MARAHGERPDADTGAGTDDGTGAGTGGGTGGASGTACADASDARLTTLLRADTPLAYPALRELRERHHPSLLAYARLCAASESAALQLAAQVFSLATRETARGREPSVPWRHQLLLLAGRSAAAWARDDHATGLDSTLLHTLRTAGPDGPVPPLLAAFESLPPRAQGLIWYGVVEREPDDRTALFLGLVPDEVAYKQQPALHLLRQACLKVRLSASEDPRCQDFRRLIEESVRPDTPRHSTDLQSHMAHCPHCTGAYEELCTLRDAPRATLAEGLLPWGGTAYARGEAADTPRRRPWGTTAETAAAPATAAGAAEPVTATITNWSEAGADTATATATATTTEIGTPDPRTADARTTDAGAGARARPASRRLVVSSVVLGVALAPLLVFLVYSGGSSSPDAADSVGTPTNPPPGSVTSPVPSSPTPSPSPSASSGERPSESPKPTKPPKATKSPSPSNTDRRTPALPSGPPLNGAYAQVVNIATGLCLDIRGELENGTDVVTATCSSRDTQRWRVDSHRNALQSFADPDLCLDSRGATDDGVGVWECDSLDDENGKNLRFTVDSQGQIRPAIAPDHAVTPDKLGSVFLAEATGHAGQRWRAGAP
ncbi:RICIN domain-containing protein [Streptomyces capitiformicae]|uniref:Ricin B lectin domain-containing protein n=1 Tax=Streptomyces capitiformicae TaxID=2014920 RepID=A0A919L937_9ACTN|nr:RICIN domain-containing protein [Streptomyces capitiformicae]GHH87251.1 hypothetical protein GCM10017771_27590 [Streptomyces capitiformicae]